LANAAETVAFEIGDKVAKSLSLFLVDAKFQKEGGKQFLRIYIDKDGGVGIDECEKFSRAFEQEFDAVDPINTEYTLEISSPGLDRKLKTEREFTHFMGRDVDVKLYKEIDGKKEFTGKLENFDGKAATINCCGEAVLVNIKDAAFIKLHFEF